jgi:hypothetical protein
VVDGRDGGRARVCVERHAVERDQLQRHAVDREIEIARRRGVDDPEVLPLAASDREGFGREPVDRRVQRELGPARITVGVFERFGIGGRVARFVDIAARRALA